VPSQSGASLACALVLLLFGCFACFEESANAAKEGKGKGDGTGVSWMRNNMPFGVKKKANKYRQLDVCVFECFAPCAFSLPPPMKPTHIHSAREREEKVFFYNKWHFLGS
jgi:hypothetical protein